MSIEILDIVDRDDIPIATIPKEEIVPGEIRNLRTISGFLINRKGELWIPRRSAFKNYCPLGLDMSFGGYVQSGEEYEAACNREIQEELRINTDKVTIALLGKLSPYQSSISSFMAVYAVYTDIAPDYNPEDFCEGGWISPDKLLEKLDQGEQAKSDLKVLVQAFFSG